MKRGSIYQTLRSVYTPKYLLVNLVLVAVYYELIRMLIAAQQFGLVFYAIPSYLIWILTITSSVLMTVAVYSILETRAWKPRYRGAVPSTVTAIAGGVFGACGCQGAVLYSVFALVFGSGEAVFLTTTLAQHVFVVFIGMSCINLLLIGHYFDALTKRECRTTRR